MGMGMSISGLGGLIGAPVNGAIVDRYGGYFHVSMYSGAICLFGGCIALVTKAATPHGILGRI
jgi:MFS family permease